MLTHSARSGDQHVPGVPRSPQGWDYKHVGYRYAEFLCGCRGSELRSACFLGKTLLNEPAPHPQLNPRFLPGESRKMCRISLDRKSRKCKTERGDCPHLLCGSGLQHVLLREQMDGCCMLQTQHSRRCCWILNSLCSKPKSEPQNVSLLFPTRSGTVTMVSPSL